MSTDQSNDTLLTPAETARLLSVDTDTLAKWRMRNSSVPLPFLKISHRVVRYRRSSIDAFLRARERQGPAGAL